MILRLSSRNIFRNRWRTFLTLAGVAVGVAMLSWTLAYFNGFLAEMIRGATSGSVGQVQIATKGYVETPSIHHSFTISEQEINSIQHIQGVINISPRINVFGLVGNENRSSVAQIIGVDPLRDAETTNVANAISEGHWLKKNAKKDPAEEEQRVTPEAVVGYKLAKKIGLKLGDELVLFFEAEDGALGNELLKVTGILKSGNTAIDRGGVFMDIKVLQEIAALEGRFHVAPIRIENVADASKIAGQIATIINKNKNPKEEQTRLVRPWGDIVPQIKQIVDVSSGANYIYLLFIYFIIAFGLFNASRMSALERQREFAMMLAIGVPRPSLFWTVLLETIAISIIGAFLGVLLGSGIAWYHSIYGLDMSSFSDAKTEGFSYMGVNFSTIVYFKVTTSSVIVPFLGIIPVGFLCGLWPAIQSARTHILQSISNRS